MKVRCCDHCGAPTPSAARCAYCGAAPVDSDGLIALDFGTTAMTWEVTPPVDLVVLEQPDARTLRVDLPPRTAVAGPTMPCAWTRGGFVDIDASVAIGFVTPSEGTAAGFWLRSTPSAFIGVTLWRTGVVTTHVTRNGAREELGTIQLAGTLGELTVLRVRLVRDVLTVFVNGVPSGAVSVPVDFHGPVELFAQTATQQRCGVRFVDPVVKLP
jgi:hypothetical protein